MPSSASRRWTLLSLWLPFFVFGVEIASVGPLLNEFSAKTGASIESLGTLFTAQFLLGLVSTILAGPAIDRFSSRPPLLVGIALFAAGIGTLAIGESLVALLIGAALFGLGGGFIDIGGQLMILRLYRDEAARPLNSMHFVFSLGAVAGPLLAVQANRLLGSGIAMFWLAVVLLLIALPALTIVGPRNLRGEVQQLGERSIFRSPTLWLLAAVFLLYVGIEVGVGGWTTEFTFNAGVFDRDQGGVLTSLYFVAFMVSRLIMTAVGSRVSFQRQFVLGVVLSTIASALYVFSGSSAPLIVISTLLLGFAFGPIYPAGFALLARRFTSAAGSAASVIGAAGSFGGMVIPPLMGVFLERLGPDSMTTLVLVISAMMTVAALLSLRGVRAALVIRPATAP
ncbi:MAG: MFS transporter [Chloroflexi bacterium]|nr:MFS transporter [Chloroflexota bacterium]